MQDDTTKAITVKVKEEEVKPYKEYEYELYCLWKRLPFVFKTPPKDKATGIRPEPKEFLEMLGIVDPQIVELSEIKTQAQFGEKYNVNEKTLVEWNNTAKARSALDDIRKWATHMTQGILMAMGNKALRKGDSYEVKLWMQMIEGWQEKQTLELQHRGAKVFEISTEDEKDESKMETNKETSSGVEVLEG